MRSKILETIDSPDLRVYAVWLNQRSTDARDEIDASILDDRRVTQYWDGEAVTGTYFADSDVAGMGYAGFVYDVYYVFDPQAAWDEDPQPVAAAGGPVLYKLDELRAALEAQL
ncbi:MAG TPA: hypothetical protein VM049_00605 [Gaiellaceae bacterium]|nr:hypothetical protein [Gaiellaceae bacterium]